MTPLLRAADALMTAILAMVAGFGCVVAIASGNGIPLLIALLAVWAICRAWRRRKEARR